MLRIGHLEPNPGKDRILCLDPPAGFWKMDRAVIRLPDRLQRAFAARYMLEVHSDGTRYTQAQRAEVLGVPRETFRRQVREAKMLVASSY